MFYRDGNPISENYFLKPGYIYIAERPTIISSVLGSCVSVCLYDRRRKVGGMNHFQLPFMDDPSKATAIYGNVSLITLIRMMTKEGTDPGHIEAQIYGGAHNPKIFLKNIGHENVRMARRILSRKKIQVVSEDVGGRKGRKILFDTGKNETVVLKVDRIRMGDWYPYENSR